MLANICQNLCCWHNSACGPSSASLQSGGVYTGTDHLAEGGLWSHEKASCYLLAFHKKFCPVGKALEVSCLQKVWMG